MKTGKIDKAYFARAEAAQFLGMSQRFLDILKSRGEIPFIRISRRKVMFARSDLDAFMVERRIDVTQKV